MCCSPYSFSFWRARRHIHRRSPHFLLTHQKGREELNKVKRYHTMRTYRFNKIGGGAPLNNNTFVKDITYLSARLFSICACIVAAATFSGELRKNISLGPWLPSQLSLKESSSNSVAPLFFARGLSKSLWSEPPDLDGVRTDRAMKPGGNCNPALTFVDAPLRLGVVWEDDGGKGWEVPLAGAVPVGSVAPL